MCLLLKKIQHYNNIWSYTIERTYELNGMLLCKCKDDKKNAVKQIVSLNFMKKHDSNQTNWLQMAFKVANNKKTGTKY